MKTMLHRYVLALLSFALSFPLLSAQSAGSITLHLIESKAESVVENDKKIGDLNTARMKSFSEEQSKLLQLKKELSDLDYEMMIALRELRDGLFCSECNRSKSEIEKALSVTFDQHIREGAAGGRHKIPASPEKIQEKTKEYEDKIAAKKEEIRRFEFEENEFARKRKEWDKQMADLADRNLNLRNEIFELSQKYNAVIVEDAQKTFEEWSASLTRIIAEKHYIEDRIDILNVKLEDLDDDERKAVSEVREKVRVKVDAERQNIKDKIAVNNTRLDEIKVLLNERLTPLKNELGKLNRKLKTIKDDLSNNKKLTEDETRKLEKEKAELEASIADLTQRIAGYQDEYKKNRADLEAKNKELDDEYWNLGSHLGARQDEAVKYVKEAFEVKRAILKDAKNARLERLKVIGDLFLAKIADYQVKSKDQMRIVLDERQRFVNACVKAACNCKGHDTYLEVVNLWGKYESCAQSTADRDIIRYGCESTTAAYKEQYAGYINGISDSDLSALQRKTTSTRFNTILKLISQ